MFEFSLTDSVSQFSVDSFKGRSRPSFNFVLSVLVSNVCRL